MVGSSWSRLTVGGDSADVSHRAVTASVELRLSDRFTVQVGGGSTLGGVLDLGARRFTLAPGWIAAAGGSLRILDGAGKWPFLIAGLGLSASGERSREDATTQAATFLTTDARLSVTAGKVFWQSLGPYVTARAFGGPVLWKLDDRNVTGSDDYHVQLGVGVVAAAGKLDVVAELVPLGERAVTVGAGYSF